MTLGQIVSNVVSAGLVAGEHAEQSAANVPQCCSRKHSCLSNGNLCKFTLEIVAGWVSLRAYELYQAYTNAEQVWPLLLPVQSRAHSSRPQHTSGADHVPRVQNAGDEEAQVQEQAAQAASQRHMQGGPVVFTYTHGLGGSRVVYGLPGTRPPSSPPAGNLCLSHWLKQKRHVAHLLQVLHVLYPPHTHG